MIYKVIHKTRYDYGDIVPECFNIVRLHPRLIGDQVCQSHRLDVVPEPSYRVKRNDYFDNQIEQFSIDSPHTSLTVTATNVIAVTSRNYAPFEQTVPWESIANHHWNSNLLASHLTRNSAHIRRNDEFADYAKPSFPAGRPIALACLDLTNRIFRDFKFDPEATTISTPVEEVFSKRAGVCQDFAHFQIACLRSLNLPARYVSGYLRTLPPPGKARLVGADASHAWVSVFGGEHGWIDFDPTNNLVPETDHITIAWGRDYADVCPIQGVFTGGGTTTMNVSVDVAPHS